jgi:hypothetical protein
MILNNHVPECDMPDFEVAAKILTLLAYAAALGAYTAALVYYVNKIRGGQ